MIITKQRLSKILLSIITVSFILGFIVFYTKTDAKFDLNYALKEAGSNRTELEKVLDHYRDNSEDPLKLEAAKYLITNMPFHSYKRDSRVFREAFDSIANYPINSIRTKVFSDLLDSISKLPSTAPILLVKDIETIDSDYLIENIDLAFEAWYKHRPEKRADFTTFCKYILPYRNGDEAIEAGTRREFLEKYSWVFDSLNANVTIEFIADSIINTFTLKNLPTLRSKYPITLSIREYDKSKIGICQDKVNYLVHLFRALGIASSDESVSHWGNHHSAGHSWFRLEYGQEIYYENHIKELYKDESIPKVNRKLYSIEYTENGNCKFYKDVTSEYKTTVNVEIPILFNDFNSDALLCVFDVNQKWAVVDEGFKRNNTLNFKEIGTNVLYVASNTSSVGEVSPVNYPFYISSDKSIHYYVPQEQIQDSVVLLRKAGFVTQRSEKKIQWLKELEGSIFQGSDTAFYSQAKILHQINKLNSTQPQLIPISNKQSFRYVWFYSNKKESHLATLKFYDFGGNKISGKVIESNTNQYVWIKGAFDDDPLSLSGGTNYYIGMELDKPQPIGFIEFQARNDDNHIRPGDSYHLFYWDKSWKSLGAQTATDTLLIYNNIPKNALFWLRNTTRGKEENVFTMDEKGKQYWLGFVN
jgi:hypothetical protein